MKYYFTQTTPLGLPNLYIVEVDKVKHTCIASLFNLAFLCTDSISPTAKPIYKMSRCTKLNKTGLKGL